MAQTPLSQCGPAATPEEEARRIQERFQYHATSLNYFKEEEEEERIEKDLDRTTAMFESYLKTHEEQQKKTYQSFSFMCEGGGGGSLLKQPGFFSRASYRVGKFAFSFPCMVRAPLGVSMALDRAWIVKRKFTQCVVPDEKVKELSSTTCLGLIPPSTKSGTYSTVSIGTYTLGKFALNYPCTVERHGDSQWRTHRAWKGKRKFTHSVVHL